MKAGIETRQRMGLGEDQDDALITGALADGYIARAAEDILTAVVTEVRRAYAGRRCDVVELGGGGGDLFNNLEPFVASYVNVEPGQVPPVIVDLRYRTIRDSAEQIGLPDASADLIACIASYDHIPNAERALAEIDRVLRPGGTLVVALNNRGSWWKTLLGRTSYWRRREAVIARSHFIQWTIGELVEHVSRRLDVTRAYTVVFFPHLPRLWPLLLPLANAVFARCLPRRGGVSIVVARKAGAT